MPVLAAAARRRFAAALLALLVLSGCRLEVVAELQVARDGSGTAGLELRLDADAAARLDELGVDPFAALTAAAGPADDWEVTRSATDDGGRAVRLVTQAADPEALTAALDQLVADLSPDDPGLVVDLDLDVDAAGAAALDGTVLLRPPATAGARRDGEPVGPAGDELAAIVAGAVTARLVVELPGPVVAHDADAVTGSGLLDVGSGQTLTWDVPVGRARTVSARSAAPPLLGPLVVATIAAAVLVLTGLAVWWWRRRRRGRR